MERYHSFCQKAINNFDALINKVIPFGFPPNIVSGIENWHPHMRKARNWCVGAKLQPKTIIFNMLVSITVIPGIAFANRLENFPSWNDGCKHT